MSRRHTMGKLAWVLAAIAACGGDGASSSSGGSSSGGGAPEGGAADAPGADAGAGGVVPGMRTIGGTVAGLVGSVEIVEQTSGAAVVVSASGVFLFPQRLADGTSWAVAVRAQPKGQTCVVAKGSGVVAADVTDVTVTCGADLYPIGGTITGLTGSIALLNNGADALTRTADGPFAFAGTLPHGAPYDVAVATHPDGQRCTVAKSTGVVAAAAVADVEVTCKAARSVGGTVSGLVSGAVVLQLDDQPGDGIVFVGENGPFTFPRRSVVGEPYAVKVLRSPPGQLCTVASGGSGTMATTDVTNVVVTCRKLVVAIDEVHARVATGAYGDANGDGVRDTAADEFVEIVNGETFPVDVGGWTVRTGATTQSDRFSFPVGTMIAAGARAVVFGGGVPTGAFGGAPTFASSLALSDAPAAFTVELVATNGSRVDAFEYDATTFPSCTTACASQTRNPPVTGAFVPHTTVSGSAGILWSPGVTPTAAIPKLAGAFSQPRPATIDVGTSAPIRVQMNMFMDPADLVEPKLRLFASPCAAPTDPITAFSSFGPGVDASQARIVPSAPLAFGKTHCVSLAASMRSANGTPLPAAVAYEFTTRPAASVPAASVVISEVGGCRFTNSSGTTGCGGTGINDEFVELYNPTANAVSIAGFHVQRRSATGGAACWATLPAGASIAPRSYYLIGGAGYTASRYPGAPVADHLETTNGTAIAGANESILLVASNAVSCTNAGDNVVDAVSIGAITTDPLTTLPLPALETTIANGRAIERKACFDSVAGAGGTGMEGGGHAVQGNSERIGSTFSDFVSRVTPNPQNSTSAAETRSCP